MKGAVEFRDVVFRYPGSTLSSLNDFSLKVGAGQSTAIIGPVGAGKSTLLNLMLRHFDVQEGTIFFDQVPIQEINPEVLRQGIGVVEQDSFLFSLSVRDNITFGYPGASEEEINDIVDCVHLSDDIKSWPDGLDTIVGDRGVSLSGGQKQRIALARALIKKPRLLLLDDAFSSLDVETERIVFTNIRERLKGVTPILVTHRLALGRSMDRIVVIENGRLAAQGTHAELMGTPGYYKNVFESQALAQEMEIILQ